MDEILETQQESVRSWVQLFSPGGAKRGLWSCPMSILCPHVSGIDILLYENVRLDGVKSSQGFCLVFLFNKWFFFLEQKQHHTVCPDPGWHCISDHPNPRVVISEGKLRPWSHLMRQREEKHSAHRALVMSATLLLWCFLTCAGNEGTHLIFHRLTYFLQDSKLYSKLPFIL